VPKKAGNLTPLLSPKASAAWDALVEKALGRNPGFVPPSKPSGWLLPEGAEQESALAPMADLDSREGHKHPYLEQIAAGEGWRRGGGQGVNVTILDESFFPGHPAFSAAMQSSALAFGDHNPRGMAHGTNVAGILAGQRPEYGFGIVPNANYRLGAYYQRSKPPKLSFLSLLVLAGHGQPPPDVLVLPIQTGGLPLETNAEFSEAIRLIVGAGVHVVASAGNRATKLTKRHFPMRPPGSILVGAGDAQGRRCDISNYGERVVAFAQGYGVFAASVDDSGRKPRPTSTNHFGGTSAATAIVAGVVCAVQGVKRLDPEQMKSVLGKDGFPCQPEAKIGIRPNLKGIFERLAVNGPYTES
jgi:subtilisin family serine protease